MSGPRSKTRLDSRDVPQAPRLAKVRRVVDSVAAGAETLKVIALETGLAQRDVSYNLAAAERALQLLRKDGSNYRLSTLGTKLSRTEPDSEAERELLLEAARTSSVLQSLGVDLLGEPRPTLARLTNALRQTGLSDTTAKRRANVLLGWRDQLFGLQQLQLLVKKAPPLHRVRVKGFKSLADVSLELGRLNVFVGANGSGKTNLLEAIGILGCAAAGRVDDEAFQHRGVRPGVPALYKTALRGPRIPRAIRLECGDLHATYRVTLDNPIEKPQPAWRISNESVTQGTKTLGSRSPGGARISVGVGGKMRSIELDPRTSVASLVRATRSEEGELAAQLLDALANFAIYTPFTPMLRGTAPDASPRRPLGLAGGQLAEATLDLLASGTKGRRVVALARLLIDWARSVDVGSPDQAQLSPSVSTKRSTVRFRDRFMVDKRSWLSAFDASEGALYVLFLSVLVAHPDTPRVVAVDNVDQGLNPRLARALIARTQEMVLEHDDSPQLLLTAHSPLILDALDLSDDRVRLFIVQRSKSGATQVRRLEWGNALKKAHEEGMTLSRLWLSGALGGMPDL